MNVDKINELIRLSLKDDDFSAKRISDGHHTFGELYEHRAVLFCALCNSHPELSWKSKKHFDNTNDPMYDGCFLAGIDTPNGTVSYHIKIKYWDDFHVKVLGNAPKYNGQCDITWLLSL